MSSGSWSIVKEDYILMVQKLEAFLKNTNSKMAILVDKTGQAVALVGNNNENYNIEGIASLCAADFAANSKISEMIGENSFSTLSHQGAKKSIFITQINKRIILVVIFDKRTAMGIIRLRAKHTKDELVPVFKNIFDKVELKVEDHGVRVMKKKIDKNFIADADNQIDDLFKGL